MKCACVNYLHLYVCSYCYDLERFYVNKLSLYIFDLSLLGSVLRTSLTQLAGFDC